MFMEKSSVFKRCNFLVLLAVSAMFWACSDDESDDFVGGASGDMGIVAKDIAGLAQKGPFVEGSAVTVQGIDCKTLKFTDEVFEGWVKSDKGDFTVESVTLKSTCALFEVTGEYRSGRDYAACADRPEGPQERKHQRAHRAGIRTPDVPRDREG